MKARVLLSLLWLATLSAMAAIEAQGLPPLGRSSGDARPTEIRDDAALKEQLLQRHFREFQEQVLKLKQRLERSPRQEDRERAVILQKVLDKAQDASISIQFEKVISDLKKDKFSNLTEIKLASQQAQKIADDLKELVDLFRSDSRAKRIKDDSELIKDILKNIEATIRQQKTVQAQNDQGRTDPKEIRDNQKDITAKIDKIAKALENKNGQGGEAKDQKGEQKDGGKGEGKKGESKDQGKDGENKKGETKDQGKGSEGKNAEAKGGDPKAGDPKGGDPKAGDPKEGQQGEAKPGQKGSESKEAGAKGSKGEGKPGESKESKGDKGKDGEPKEGGAKDQGKEKGGVKEKTAEAKGGEKKEAKKEGGDKQGEAKSGPKDGNDKQGGAKDAKPGADSKPGDPKGGGKESKPGKQGEAKPGQKSQGQGEAKDGGDPKDSPQGSPKADPNQKKPGPQDPASNKIREAEEKSGDAEKKIADNKRPEASKDQGDTIKKLEDAKKKLEDLLRQLREEEKERVLADLLKRCEKMLAMQIEVLAGTEGVFASIQKNEDKKPAQPNRVESARLSDKEKDIVGEASRAIEVLEAEGTAVAFPEVFQQVREDMKHVQRRLDVTDAGPVTQAIERDIIDSLKEMIEALKKAKKDMDDKKADPKPPGDPKASQPKDDKLLEQIAELKMIRSMQLRVNARTETYGKLYPGEQAGEPAIRREVIGLSERQERIFEITNRIAKGDNK